MTSPFHQGELAVQARAGVAEQAKRVGRIIGDRLPEGADKFLAGLPILFRGGLDARGWVWASVLTGNPGFIRTNGDRGVVIKTDGQAGDPLVAGGDTIAPAGFLAIDLATRQRFRFNGRARQEGDELRIDVEQAYGNCPKYIQRREVVGRDDVWTCGDAVVDTTLSDDDLRLIRGADTFFIASHARDHGADVSHRGGTPGFVRVTAEGGVVFEDYPGNNMFQTLGNLAADPRAGLLFIDFDSGSTLQLTGKADTRWSEPSATNYNQTGRAVMFTPEAIVRTPGAFPWRWVLRDYSPYNPEEVRTGVALGSDGSGESGRA